MRVLRLRFAFSVLRDTGPQSCPKMVKKIEFVQVCSMTSDKTISAIGTEIRPLSHEIHALKVDENGK